MLSAEETVRLHRWTMWRMSVNEGIISCLHQDGPHRVLPLYSQQVPVPPAGNHLLSLEQPLRFTRRLNLREKYGSIQGLTDDTYFIFGLPRVKICDEIPEVASLSSHNMYGELDASTDDERAAELILKNSNLTHAYAVGQVPDERSVTSNNDLEIQRINGFRDERIFERSTSTRKNLYSIREEKRGERWHEEKGNNNIVPVKHYLQSNFPLSLSPADPYSEQRVGYSFPVYPRKDRPASPAAVESQRSGYQCTNFDDAGSKHGYLHILPKDTNTEQVRRETKYIWNEY